MEIKFCRLCLAAAFAFAFAGCGGGGSSDHGGDDPPQPPVDDIADADIRDDVPEGRDLSYLLGDPGIDLPTTNDEFVDIVIPESDNAEFSLRNVRYGHVQKNQNGTYRYYLPHDLLNDNSWNDYKEVVEYTVAGELYYVSFPLAADPLFFEQWHLRNVAQSGFLADKYVHDLLPGRDINVIPAWKSGATGAGVSVAVIDAGFDTSHEDLKKQLDLEHSYNFADGNNDPADLVNAHGTAVSGIIAASAKNKKGVRGIAFDSKIIALKGFNNERGIFSSQFLNYADLVNQSYSQQIPSIDYSLADYIDALYEKDIPVVKSHGNEFLKKYLSKSSCTKLGVNCFFKQGSYYNVSPGVIPVAALSGGGKHAEYSTGGSDIWISAFGGENNKILTTDPTSCEFQLVGTLFKAGFEFDFARGVYEPYNIGCKYTSKMNGTSSAAPMISGTVALMKSAVADLTVPQIKYALAKTAVNDLGDRAMSDSDVEDPDMENLTVHKGWTSTQSGLRFSSVYGFGRVNAGRAVDLIKRCSEDENCNRRNVKPLKITSTMSECVSVENGAEYNSFECEIGGFVDEDGDDFTGNAQIEHTVLSVNANSLVYPGPVNYGAITLTQFELVKNDFRNAVSFPKQMHECISLLLGDTIMMSNNVFYLAPFNDSKFTLYIRTVSDLSSEQVDPQIILYVYPD